MTVILSCRRINPGWLAGQPSVPCVRRGMVYLARGPADEEELENLLHMAAANGLTADGRVRRIDLAELARLEPELNTDGVTAALLSKDESIVDPWLVGKGKNTYFLGLFFKYCSIILCKMSNNVY